MNQALFDQLERALAAGGPGASFDLLIGTLLEQKNYTLVFEARLMQKRHALGLPLIFRGSLADVPPEHQAAYEAAVSDAARETGHAFLADRDIVRAWPYFRAIGEPAAVVAAIDAVQPGDGIEPILAIALREGVNIRKGFELLLDHRGICEGIDFATQYPDRESRVVLLQLLVKAFYRELVTHVKEAIATVDGQAPETDSLSALLAGRDWLFDGGSFYIENSHLAAILQTSPDVEDRETLRLMRELADYGQRLAPIHHFRTDPPFDDPYVDFGAYLRAVLGEDTDEALMHFHRKMAASVPGSAEALVGLLVRLGRYDTALQLSLDHLGGEAGAGCPSAIQLCQMAGDYQQLRDVARKEGDLLGFVAGIIQG